MENMEKYFEMFENNWNIVKNKRYLCYNDVEVIYDIIDIVFNIDCLYDVNCYYQYENYNYGRKLKVVCELKDDYFFTCDIIIKYGVDFPLFVTNGKIEKNVNLNEYEDIWELYDMTYD